MYIFSFVVPKLSKLNVLGSILVILEYIQKQHRNATQGRPLSLSVSLSLNRGWICVGRPCSGRWQLPETVGKINLAGSGVFFFFSCTGEGIIYYAGGGRS